MSDALNRINKIVSKETSTWLDDANERQTNKEWFFKSAKIAIRILREIRRQKPINGMTQKKLADELGVSPQYINKVVKGKENLTLETIDKIEKVLKITLVEVPKSESISYATPEPFAQFVSRYNSKLIGTMDSPMQTEENYVYESDYLATGTHG